MTADRANAYVRIRKCGFGLLAAAMFAIPGAARAGDLGQVCATPETPQAVRRCDSRVTSAAVRKNEIFLSRGTSVLAFRVGQSLDSATVIIRSRPGRKIEAIYPALDAIYVLAHEDGNAGLLRVPVRHDGIAEIGFTQKYVCHSRNCRSLPELGRVRVVSIPLPVAGVISEVFVHPERRGITLRFAARADVPYVYEPGAARFKESGKASMP